MTTFSLTRLDLRSEPSSDAGHLQTPVVIAWLNPFRGDTTLTGRLASVTVPEITRGRFTERRGLFDLRLYVADGWLRSRIAISNSITWSNRRRSRPVRSAMRSKR